MIQSVDRAARILAVLGAGPPRLGVTEIAARVGLAKPTVHGLLRTLEQHDLVAQDPDTGKYSLGPGVVSLGNAFLGGSELRARSLRWTEALAQRAAEAVWVATLSGSRVIVLHHVFRPDDTVQILEVGATIPWHACALGHAIVAHRPAPEQSRALAEELTPLTGQTKTTRAALTRALTQVRSLPGTGWWLVRSGWSARRTGCSARPAVRPSSARSRTRPGPSPATWGRGAVTRWARRVPGCPR
jgi:DNA-binding IclR family transcriptional regulator